MGLRSQSVKTRARPGVALPAALFGLVTVTVLAAAIFAASMMQSYASRNRESSGRALQLAENGLAHAVTVARDSLRKLSMTRLLRGGDDVAGNADDGRLVGYALSSAIDIPAAGRTFGDGSYTIEITDDDDGDGNLLADVNMLVRMRCTAVTSDSGRAVLDVMLGVAALPAIASNGNMSVGNSVEVLGLCGGVHSNDNLTLIGTPTIAGRATASDAATGTSEDVLGNTRTPMSGQPEVTIPPMSYADFCGAPGTNATVNKPDVEFWFTTSGMIYRKGNPVPYDATSTKQFGWRRTGASPVVWDFNNPTSTPGRMCIEGNVLISSGVGSAAAPVQWSIIATGSIGVSGNPYITMATEDSVLFVSGGDISITGNPSGTAISYDGLIYANSQCVVAGTPTIYGQLLCRDQLTGTGNTEYAVTTTISGSPTISYGCTGFLARRRIFSWIQRVE
jgi:hypothetical protein